MSGAVVVQFGVCKTSVAGKAAAVALNKDNLLCAFFGNLHKVLIYTQFLCRADGIDGNLLIYRSNGEVIKQILLNKLRRLVKLKNVVHICVHCIEARAHIAKNRIFAIFGSLHKRCLQLVRGSLACLHITLAGEGHSAAELVQILRIAYCVTCPLKQHLCKAGYLQLIRVVLGDTHTSGNAGWEIDHNLLSCSALFPSALRTSALLNLVRILREMLCPSWNALEGGPARRRGHSPKDPLAKYIS